MEDQLSYDINVPASLYTVLIWGGDKVTSTLDDSVGATQQTEWNQYVSVSNNYDIMWCDILIYMYYIEYWYDM